MKLLIADDSEEKVKELKAYFNSRKENVDIHVCESFKDAITLIMNETFDLVMLDMTMPAKSKGRKGANNRKRSLAGKDVLSTLSYYGINNTKFIIFTRFSEFGRMDEVISIGEIYNQLMDSHREVLLGYVTYDNSTNAWQKELDNLIIGLGK